MPISREVRDRAPDPFLKVAELNKEIETLKRELSVQSLLTRGKSTMGKSRAFKNPAWVKLHSEKFGLTLWQFGTIATIRASSLRCKKFFYICPAVSEVFRVYRVPSGLC